MKKHWKGILAAVIAVLLVISAVFWGWLGIFSATHAKLVYSINRERFEIVGRQVMEQGSTEWVTAPSGVKDLDYYETQSGCVDFYMGGFGLAPSTVYWGVIYTTEDAPIGWGGLDVDYTWDGEGWYWQEENSDNYSYVTKLDDHWYLYKMWF